MAIHVSINPPTTYLTRTVLDFYGKDIVSLYNLTAGGGVLVKASSLAAWTFQIMPLKLKVAAAAVNSAWTNF